MRSTGLLSWLAMLALSNGAVIAPRRDGWEDPRHIKQRLRVRQQPVTNGSSLDPSPVLNPEPATTVPATESQPATSATWVANSTVATLISSVSSSPTPTAFQDLYFCPGTHVRLKDAYAALYYIIYAAFYYIIYASPFHDIYAASYHIIYAASYHIIYAASYHIIYAAFYHIIYAASYYIIYAASYYIIYASPFHDICAALDVNCANCAALYDTRAGTTGLPVLETMPGKPIWLLDPTGYHKVFEGDKLGSVNYFATSDAASEGVSENIAQWCFDKCNGEDQCKSVFIYRVLLTNGFTWQENYHCDRFTLLWGEDYLNKNVAGNDAGVAFDKASAM
ncbi:hypothetical protein LZ31DRAFT_593794 [Colletotrichum somersetense]|nr:hypothetical protein LZ31DRAFT_593794 [Colletotrichum somersetense]